MDMHLIMVWDRGEVVAMGCLQETNIAGCNVTASLHAADAPGPVPDAGAASLHKALKQGRDAEDVRHCRDKWQVTGIQG